MRFITEGKQTELRGKATKGGYTVWKMKSGHPTPIYVADLDKAVREGANKSPNAKKRLCK